MAQTTEKKKELIETKNMAETLTYTTEKALRDAGDKITVEEKKPVEEKIEALKKVKDSDDLAVIKKATEELSQAAQKIGEKLYKAAADSAKTTSSQAGSTGNQNPGDQPKEGESSNAEPSVKDAETEEKRGR